MFHTQERTVLIRSPPILIKTAKLNINNISIFLKTTFENVSNVEQRSQKRTVFIRSPPILIKTAKVLLKVSWRSLWKNMNMLVFSWSAFLRIHLFTTFSLAFLLNSFLLFSTFKNSYNSKRIQTNKLKEQYDWRRVSYTRNLRRQYLLSNKNRRSINLQSEEPIMEGTTFGWVIHCENDSDSQSFFSRETSDYERLYNLDVLGFGDRGEDDELDVYSEFKENIVRKRNGTYEVSIPWIPGAKLHGTN